jgi:hypothetical protein
LNSEDIVLKDVENILDDYFYKYFHKNTQDMRKNDKIADLIKSDYNFGYSTLKKYSNSITNKNYYNNYIQLKKKMCRNYLKSLQKQKKEYTLNKYSFLFYNKHRVVPSYSKNFNLLQKHIITKPIYNLRSFTKNFKFKILSKNQYRYKNFKFLRLNRKHFNSQIVKDIQDSFLKVNYINAYLLLPQNQITFSNKTSYFSTGYVNNSKKS